MSDFVTLADVRAALDVATGDTSNDAMFTAAITTSTALILDYLNRDPRADDFVERTDGRGIGQVLLRQYPINSVAAVSIDDVALTLDQVDFDENSVWLRGCQRFPRGRGRVTVSYNAGLDPLPKSIKQAALYVVRALLTSRKVDLNATGDSWAGVSSQAWDPAGPGTIPPAARTLLAPYVNRFVA